MSHLGHWVRTNHCTAGIGRFATGAGLEGAGVGVRVEVEGYRRWWWWCQGEAAGCCLVRVTARTRQMVETGLISSPRPGLLGTSDHTSPLHCTAPGPVLGTTHPYLHVLATLPDFTFNITLRWRNWNPFKSCPDSFYPPLIVTKNTIQYWFTCVRCFSASLQQCTIYLLWTIQHIFHYRLPCSIRLRSVLVSAGVFWCYCPLPLLNTRYISPMCSISCSQAHVFKREIWN